MALVAAAVCPHPPLLVPDVAAGAAAETADVRAAASAAVTTLVRADPDVVFVVGDAPETLAFSSADAGTLAPYGVDLVVPLGPRLCAGQPILPLSLTVGAWLLRETGWTGDRQGYGVARTTTLDAALQAGREIASVADRVAVLCMGDGAARGSERSPGYVDPRAAEFNEQVGAALATADLDVLKALDHDIADALLVAGTRTWQVLAGAADGAAWDAAVLYRAAPYGVAYYVATWLRSQD
ncbi:MAG: hypothetical protein LC640_13100 [Frankia sp.]|nr:hypothetical protein [Frankia sp.]